MQKLHNPAVPNAEEIAKAASSHGKNPRSVKPKEVVPPDASAQDLARRLAREEAEADEHDEEMLDNAVEMTFPASDPIAVHPHDRHR